MPLESAVWTKTYGRPGMAMPTGVLGFTEKVAGLVGDSVPLALIRKPATSFIPLFATYKNFPLGSIVIPTGLVPAPVEVEGVIAVN